MKAVEFGTLFRFIRNGMNVKQDKSGDGLPITRIETISDATVDETRVGFAGLQEADCRGWFLETGDILFSHINSVEHVGKCAVYRGKPEKLVHGMNLLCLRSDTAKLLPEFAKYIIRGTEFRTRLSNFINKAVNQASVSIGNLKTIPVTVPPLAEQKRIAEVLDKAEELRAKRRAALAQLDTLSQSIFLDLLSSAESQFRSVRLSDICEEDAPITYGILQPGPYVPGGIPYVRPSEIKDGRINLAAIRRTTPAIATKYRKSALREGDILITIVGTIGSIAIIPSELEGGNITQSSARVRVCQRKTNRQFVEYFLRSHLAKRQYDQHRLGVAVERLNLHHIRDLEVPLPPTPLQYEFAQRITVADKLKATQRAALAELDTLFASLQHRAFQGEL